MLGNIGPLEIIIVLIIALIVFGPKRLPELGNSLGKGIREFKDSVTGDHHDEETQEEAAKPISAHHATPTQVKPATTHRIEADKVEAGPDTKA
jgi:sec-independent protein translocase protein TatA